MELKFEIKKKLKELLYIFEKYGEKELDVYISDIYYLLSLYSLNIIAFNQLKNESFNIMNNWFPNNSRSGLNEFYFSDEENGNNISLNKEWRELINEIKLLINEL